MEKKKRMAARILFLFINRAITASNTVKFTADGKAVASAEFKTKYELGKDYNMVAYGGATKEWFEQADAFETVVAGKTLTEKGYYPYYMYRQSRQAGNLENVGYSKKGYESLYNMLIMEEVQTIFAVGAGASTKIVQGNKIDRIFNYKYPYEYISGYDKIAERKNGIKSFYLSY